MDGPPDPTDFWAKLTYENDDRQYGDIIAWHPLLAHSADVAAVMEALLERTILRKRLARLIGWDDLSDVHVARLSMLAAIHDAGKVNHGFQNQAFPGADRNPGHVQPMVNVIEAGSQWHQRLLLPLGLDRTMSWFEGELDPTHYLYATWSHHGEPITARSYVPSDLWTQNEKRDPESELKRLGDSVQEWFLEAVHEAKPFPKGYPAFQHAFNGLLTLADWIGSGFPYAKESDQHLLDRARGFAVERLEAQALDPRYCRAVLGETPVGFEGIIRPEWTPHNVQEVCLDHTVHENGGLTILESDTGSGKTEAAIARFFRLYQEGHVDGMYFAVPTRTAAKQLYTRVQSVVDEVYTGKGNPPPVVQAVPGYFKADGAEGSPIAPFKVQWYDDVEEDEVRERRWAAEHPKRYLAGAIVIGTVDQVLLSTLQVKHAHMRASALLRHFLVVDEVHASDVYMTRLLRSVLDQHLNAGGHALLMSATLGTESRVRMTTDGSGEVPPPDEAENTGYPLVTHVDASRSDPTLEPTESSGYRKSVEMIPRPIAGKYNDIARIAVEAARSGGRVLIIRNRVQDCIATQEALEAEIGEDEHLLLQVNGVQAPHHSRFAPVDRSRLDDAIERGFGKETPIEGIVAVATQTVEQSLDLSASLLISDLCPVDVLLQRMGRLHRHGRTHPSGFEDPQCIVITPESRDLAPAIVEGGEMDGCGLKGPHGLGTVYQDLRNIEATWRILEDDDLDTWTIPDDNRRLVERGTHPVVLEEIAEELGGMWERHQRWVFGERAARAEASRNVELQRHKNFGDQSFGDDLEFVKTRLGQDDVRIEFPELLQGPFDVPNSPSVSHVSIPEHLVDEVIVDEIEDVDVTDIVRSEGGFRFAVELREFNYGRFGLEGVSDR